MKMVIEMLETALEKLGYVAAGIVYTACEKPYSDACDFLRAAIIELKNKPPCEQEYEKIYDAGFYDGECYYAGGDIPGELPKGSSFFHKSWSPSREPEEE
jgi:hypothetical protein